MEAAFRVLYPDSSRKPFRALIRRARNEGVLPTNIAELAEAGAELRNLSSHPRNSGSIHPWDGRAYAGEYPPLGCLGHDGSLRHNRTAAKAQETW